MPLTLVPPRAGRSNFYRVRGTYLGVYLDRSTESREKKGAERILAGWKRQIETGEIRGRGELTFDAAVASHVQAGGEERFLDRVVAWFGTKVLAREVTQAMVDRCAAELYPDATSATRARQVYAPLRAVLRHANIMTPIELPKGAAGKARTAFLTFEQIRKVQLEATKIDRELGILFLTIAYTGLRLSEALDLRPSGLNELDQGHAFIGRTKNGDPRKVLIVPVIAAALRSHPRGLARDDDAPVFNRWARTRKHLYEDVRKAYARAKINYHGMPWHILRHSYGAAMTRLGADLVATNVWRSPAAARVYQHHTFNEEAAKAGKLPGAKG